MKYFVILMVALFGIQARGAELVLGKPAPELQVRLLESGEVVRLSQLRGKTVIVNFWATWCAPCKAELPAFQAYLDQHKGDGLEILAISMDDPRDESAVRKIAQQYHFSVALQADSSLKGFGRIWRMPTTFVIDKEGILRRNGHIGDAEMSTAELESLVTPLLRK